MGRNSKISDPGDLALSTDLRGDVRCGGPLHWNQGVPMNSTSWRYIAKFRRWAAADKLSRKVIC
jgi:hypothetical protein